MEKSRRKSSFITIKSMASFRMTPLWFFFFFTLPHLCVKHNVVFSIARQRVTRMKEWNVHREQFVSAWMETWKLHLLGRDKHTSGPWRQHTCRFTRDTHARTHAKAQDVHCMCVCVCLSVALSVWISNYFHPAEQIWSICGMNKETQKSFSWSWKISESRSAESL